MMYGERRFMHFWVDILIVLYIFGFGTARLGEWRLNHIHSINGAEVINASVSDSSAEIDYSVCSEMYSIIIHDFYGAPFKTPLFRNYS